MASCDQHISVPSTTCTAMCFSSRPRNSWLMNRKQVGNSLLHYWIDALLRAGWTYRLVGDAPLLIVVNDSRGDGHG
ncbi:hypothetical protein NC653_041941 [Populus alba x Populus x berolinensis]|uniref:Uncharacterized protein n=1 Tax=Populus alba x Populus x berolinensis TaxID=444605 RepID=A0AAD6L9R6_9ROSI|nr:hypothetical protein NC653_041941 [Populus alba x Populus x berolinensis]